MSGLRIGVLGLGYVGFPLAKSLGFKFDVVGYDVNPSVVEELKANTESFLCEVTSRPDDLANVTVFIVTVPTPVDEFKEPDLSIVKSASEIVGKYLKKGDLVVYESTVFPGCTEDFCAPILERVSTLDYKAGDFLLGYSPERMNPGDSIHTVANIVKVISANNFVGLEIMEKIYGSIVEAGLYKASSIKVAEAAKVIENTQRDVNIALMNELSILFGKLGIDSNEVFTAAETKWNFLPFRPGLVGGHCIGVDPYYLLKVANRVNFDSLLVRSSRITNESMVGYVADNILRSTTSLRLADGELGLLKLSCLIIGVSFKANCNDIRNSKNVELCSVLEELGFAVSWFDPLVAEEFDIDGCERVTKPLFDQYELVVICNVHREVEKALSELVLAVQPGTTTICKPMIFDLCSALPRRMCRWSL